MQDQFNNMNSLHELRMLKKKVTGKWQMPLQQKMLKKREDGLLNALNERWFSQI